VRARLRAANQEADAAVFRHNLARRLLDVGRKRLGGGLADPAATRR
jgi:hypothetical protein